jgi:hypothetical protein
MTTNAVDTEKTPTTSPSQVKGKRDQLMKAAGKPSADRANKKAEVIAMMKRCEGEHPSRDSEGHGLAAEHSAGLSSAF